jgi:hypothetical protein
MFPETDPAKAGMRGDQHSGRHGGLSDLGGNIKSGTNSLRGIDDNGGSAARFFYTAKADADDRIGSKHPTVKPLDLMQWLVRLVTPPNRVELVCESCNNPQHDEAQMQAMRRGNNKSPSNGEVLLPEMPGRELCDPPESLSSVREDSATSARDTLLEGMPFNVDETPEKTSAADAMRALRRDISAAKGQQSPLLQQAVCGKSGGPSEAQAPLQIDPRLSTSLSTGTSDGDQSGLRHGASVCDVGSTRETPPSDRGGSSQEWRKGRQSDVKFDNHDEEAAE